LKLGGVRFADLHISRVNCLN